MAIRLSLSLFLSWGETRKTCQGYRVKTRTGMCFFLVQKMEASLPRFIINGKVRRLPELVFIFLYFYADARSFNAQLEPTIYI